MRTLSVATLPRGRRIDGRSKRAPRDGELRRCRAIRCRARGKFANGTSNVSRRVRLIQLFERVFNVQLPLYPGDTLPCFKRALGSCLQRYSVKKLNRFRQQRLHTRLAIIRCHEREKHCLVVVPHCCASQRPTTRGSIGGAVGSCGGQCAH